MKMSENEDFEKEMEFLESLPEMKTREFKKADSAYLKENARQRRESTQQMANLWGMFLNLQKQFRMFAESIQKFMSAMTGRFSPGRRRKLDS